MATATSHHRATGNERTINAHALGIACGMLLGCWHVAWSILVLVGWAQSIIDFVFWLHFIEPPYHVGLFDWPRALGVIAGTAVVGYALGSFAGVIWNRLEAARV